MGRTNLVLCTLYRVLRTYDLRPIPPLTIMFPPIDNPTAAARDQLQPPRQFSIATLLLVTTLIGVCLGLFRFSPVLGVLSLALIVPAVIRTTLLARREKFFGGKLSAAEKVAVFLGSVIVAFLCLAATVIAGGVACTVCVLGGGAVSLAIGGNNVPATDGVVVLAGMLGFVATLLAGAYTGWKTFLVTWPPRDDFVRQLHRGEIVHIPEKRPPERSEP